MSSSRHTGRTTEVDSGAPAPSSGNLHLKRESLLAKLFPSQVERPRVGRYDVLEFVGEGGMGTVFAAYDPQLDRRVAIKRLRQALGGGPKWRARLLREAQSLARLSHPNVVTIHEVWEEAGEVHLAMEFIEGQTLARWHARRRPWSEVLAAYRAAGEGLSAVHAAGLVYRDFKPHNVIRRDDGVVKVLDFGLARPTGDASTDDGRSEFDPRTASNEALTRPGSLVGTPAYMAPEQRRGEPADARADQFGFCVALWEGLFGTLPFERRDVREDATMPPRVDPPAEAGVPGWLRRVVDRGLAVDPAERYPTMHALLRALDADPAKKRRRWLMAGGAALAMVAGGAAVAELRGDATCELPDPIWSEQRRSEVRAGVLATELGYAEQTWALLEPRLDGYATELSQARRSAYVHHVRGLVADSAYERQLQCLDRRRAQWDTLTDLLADADATAVTRANGAIGELPPPEHCTDPSIASPEEGPPDAIAEPVAAVRMELARAQAEEAAGHYQGAYDRAAALAERSSQLDYGPLHAEVHLRMGSALMQQGTPAAAELERALFSALAHDQPQVAAEAAAKRLYDRVELHDRLADVTDEIAMAQALVLREEVSDWRVQWVVDNNAAIALERHGDATGALSHYEAALGHIPPRAAEGRFESAVTHLNRAPALAITGQADQAQRSVELAVADLIALFGSQHPQVAVARATQAWVLADVGRNDAAAQVVATLLAAHDESTPPIDRVEVLSVALRIARDQRDSAAIRGYIGRLQELLPPTDDPPGVMQLDMEVAAAWAATLDGDASGVDALAQFELGLRDDARARVALSRAEILLALDRPDGASAVLEQVRSGEDPWPRLSELYERRASVLDALVRARRATTAQQQQHAYTMLMDVHSLRPALDLRQRAAVQQALSALEKQRGNRAEAIKWAERSQQTVASFDPDSPEVTAAQQAVREASAEPATP